VRCGDHRICGQALRKVEGKSAALRLNPTIAGIIDKVLRVVPPEIDCPDNIGRIIHIPSAAISKKLDANVDVLGSRAASRRK